MEGKLLENRIVVINGEINSDSSYDTITKLLYLDSVSDDDINIYINSSGGDVREGLAIIDCMNFIKSDVSTLCLGKAYSMASIILSSGTKNKRYALPNSEIMIHEPFTSASGREQEISIFNKRIGKTKNALIDILLKTTNKNKKEIIDSMNYDNFMNSKEAKEYGIIDSIISTKTVENHWN